MLGNIEKFNQTGNEPEKKKLKIGKLNLSIITFEYIIAGLVSLIVAILFAKIGYGGPNSTDVELYLNLGLNGLKDTFVLNRYFHIFIQKIFVEFASTPLEGYHNFWGFLMGANMFLIYFSARNVLKRSNFLNGIIAVLIFFSITAIAKISGVVVVDFSAMLMTLLVAAVYIISIKHNHGNPWIVALMGFFFFLGLKTKETVLPVAILFLGLGLSEANTFSMKKLLKNLVWVLCGIVGGMIFFGILSWAILGDPFFGLRVSEWQEFLSTYAVHPTSVLDTMIKEEDFLGGWYQRFWFAELLIPFLLYLLSGIKSSETSFSRKLIWLIPLVYTIFLIITINNSLGYVARFGFPAMPIISFLAAQIVYIRLPKTKNGRWKLFVYLVIGGILVVLIRLLMWNDNPYFISQLAALVKWIYYPIMLSFLLASLLLFSKTNKADLFNFFMILSLLSFSLASNLKDMFIERNNEKVFLSVILPFSEFKEQISFSQDMTFYITTSALSIHSANLMKNVDEVLSLFNIYFDASATRSNFVIVGDDLQIIEDLSGDMSYDYVLLTSEQWDEVEASGDLASAVLSYYQINYGDGGRLILLSQLK